jgi:hypothetical protein
LQLPAELRLNVYSHLLPREAHIAIVDQPLRDHKPPRISLSVMRTNRRLHDEVAKYFYERRTLFMIVVRDQDSPTLSDECLSHYYQTVAMMRPQTRHLFVAMEIQLGGDVRSGGLREQISSMPRCWGTKGPGARPMMRNIFDLLPNLTAVIFSFLQPARVFTRSYGKRAQALEWVLHHVPFKAEVRWGAWSDDVTAVSAHPLQRDVSNMTRHFADREARDLRSILECRGFLTSCPSVAAQLEANRTLNSPVGHGLGVEATRTLT